AIMGTPNYMAPEQADDAHAADIRSDLYSLGCTLYHLLTGQIPFPGGSLGDKLMKHRLNEPAPVEQLRPDVPPALAAVVRKLMAKKPEDRYQAPAELVRALEPFARTGGIGATPAAVAATPALRLPDAASPTLEQSSSTPHGVQKPVPLALPVP